MRHTRHDDGSPPLQWEHQGRKYGAVLFDSEGNEIDSVQIMVWDGRTSRWCWCGGADGPVVSALVELHREKSLLIPTGT